GVAHGATSGIADDLTGVRSLTAAAASALQPRHSIASVAQGRCKAIGIQPDLARATPNYRGLDAFTAGQRARLCFQSGKKKST
ncbi:hypothetical protein, partial [Xanthomonas perforans]|uniref:hypothetical protein n=1 Tax=Xanthomonas perforans TaxID=442694 RepID=UPI0019D09A18